MFKNWAKKQHYKSKIQNTLKKIWDVQFLLSQYQLMREGFRVEYDRIKENVDALDTYKVLLEGYGLEKAKDLMKHAEVAHVARQEIKDKHKLNEEEKDILENLEKNMAMKKADLERLAKQMETIDFQIEGSPKAPDKPGVKQTIDNLKSVIDMLKDMIRKL